MRSYWENVGEHIRNLGNILGTHRKLVGNKVGTKQTQPKRNYGSLGCMLPHLIGLFINK